MSPRVDFILGPRTEHLEALQRRNTLQNIFLRKIQRLNVFGDLTHNSFGLGGFLSYSVQLGEQFLNPKLSENWRIQNAQQC